MSERHDSKVRKKINPEYRKKSNVLIINYDKMLVSDNNSQMNIIDYIFSKFNSSILIDEDKIRDKISKLSKQNKIENILLSEIIFTINDNENLESKFNNIKNSINKIGFEETAKIYSVSDSKKNGGNLGETGSVAFHFKQVGEISFDISINVPDAKVISP